MASVVLFESAYGYALFDRLASDEIGAASVDAIAASMQDLARFGRVVKLRAFMPFRTAAEALQEINDVSEGIMSETLRSFLELNVAQAAGKKKAGLVLGVGDKTLAGAIKAGLGVECVSDDAVAEIVRGVRLFAHTMLQQHTAMTGGVSDAGISDLERAQLGLGHSYSRAKVKFNVHRSDNMIIQASALLDQLDRDINTFAMRLREWYSWHFPELARLVPEPGAYARVVLAVGAKDSLVAGDATEGAQPAVEQALADSGDAAPAGRAQAISEAARTSMGSDIAPVDLANVHNFAERVLALSQYREQLHAYLTGKMDVVAPNLSSLIGEVVGARLISRAGSLTNLSKFPASTVQILGAEKALFRALKTRGKTPKYGLIYHSSFIGRAGTRNKGRISRYLSNKCAIASRIDCFSETPTRRFGEAMRSQVEERLEFLESAGSTGDHTTLRKNADVMAKAAKKVAKEAASEAAVEAAAEAAAEAAPKAKASKKRTAEDAPASAKKSRKAQ